MDFLITSFKNTLYKDIRNVDDHLFLSFEENHKITQREFIYENEQFLILSDTNISFISTFKNREITETLLKENINNFKNGYVIIIDKKSKNITLYNDVFGYYHLFYLKTNTQLIITSNFKNLLSFSSLELDSFATLDMLLFNYTLLDRTIVKDIKRIKGGTVVKIDNNSQHFDVLHNYADNFQFTKNKKIDVNNIGKIINKSISEDLAHNQKNYLTITGGFDSRTILASLCNQKIKFNSLTFGQKGNIEIETIKPFIKKFSQNHNNIFLDQDYVGNLELLLNEYLDINLDCPNILDSPHYMLVKKSILNSNFIAGFLFGELLSGPTVGSQVTFTGFARTLLLTKDHNYLKQTLLNLITKLKIVNTSKINEFIDIYLKSLQPYSFQNDKLQILRFLINETYCKFFGSVNKVFRNHSNLVVPFIDVELLDSILNSKFSFLNDKPFHRKARLNLKRKIFHSRLILSLCPGLASTKFDRLYRVKDLCYIHLYPLAIFGYLKSHIGKSNKKNFPRPHFYDLWYKKMTIDTLVKSSMSNFHDMFSSKNREELRTFYENAESHEKKKLSNIMSLKKVINLITENQ